jgi:hypothetical protein
VVKTEPPERSGTPPSNEEYSSHNLDFGSPDTLTWLEDVAVLAQANSDVVVLSPAPADEPAHREVVDVDNQDSNPHALIRWGGFSRPN